MKHIVLFLLIGLGFSPSIRAQTRFASQTVTITVAEIHAFQLHDENVDIQIKTAEAGSNPAPVEASSSYSLTENTAKWKVTAHLDENLPDGLEMEAQMMTGESAGPGFSNLSINPVTLLTGTGGKKGANQQIRYRVAATANLTPGSYRQTVIYTITTQQ